MTTQSTRCRVCGRALWQPEAIKRGMGLKCALKMGALVKRIRRARSRKQQQLGVPLFDLEAM